jgi:hypothetical protein
MMRCCNGRFLQRTVVQNCDTITIYWHCEICGFVHKEEQE